MSTAARPATTRSAPARPRPGTRPGPSARAAARRRPSLVEVPAAAPAVAGNGVFAGVVVALLLGGMAVLLVLNTTLAQGAFEITALTRAQNALAVQEQTLLQQVAVEESPESLQSRADKLGMVPVSAPVFLRLSDGAVLGTPIPAAQPGSGPVRTPSSTAATGPAHPAAATQPTAVARPATAARPGAAARPTRVVGIDAAVLVPAPRAHGAVARTTSPSTSGGHR